ncbi:SDR family NAD(P)-dependent oxidoreductase [Novosphingobium sp.]|uniref:SDR family NAD(P)-dependent oxidoreductase n=1 Tax=Novosphingobium sp. TaxID=1874826 RepID=UPI002733AF18|nr:SDR family oxidoreductase [Novosphingobium sp.]MDP3907351.1 SDR family oxidoreductase [Novosphingobium sp.]
MIRDLTGRVALVTGGSDGIGFATAKLLLERGAIVAICARRQEKLDEATAALSGLGTFEAHQLDVTDEVAYNGLIEDLAKRHGRFDMLVNNAMSVHYAPLTQLTMAHWRKDFAVNADAVFTGTRAAMRIMLKQGSGSIVNIASTNGLKAAPYMTSYSASKAALIHFTAVAAMEGAPYGVRVNTIVPGMIMTAATEDYLAKAGEQGQKTMDAIPMKRGANPVEVARAIAFMLSDEASYITGVALPVDGGKAVQLYLP